MCQRIIEDPTFYFFLSYVYSRVNGSFYQGEKCVYNLGS